MAGYGSYNKGAKAWNGEAKGELYPYAIFDVSCIWIPADNVYVFAMSLEDAMKGVAGMLEDGIKQIEIGVPSGDIVSIDARYVDFTDEEDE